MVISLYKALIACKEKGKKEINKNIEKQNK